MRDVLFESDPPLPQLLDAIERKLETIVEALSLADVTTAMQVDDAAVRIPMILRRARNIKNCFATINRLPPETLVHIAAFFAKERDLINATAVCQRWRTILLSFPLLWRNAGGSSSEIQAYLERSKPTPLDVDLSHPSLVELVVPHTSRLAGLTVRLHPSSNFSQIVECLRFPIPTLHTFRIYTTLPHLHMLEFPQIFNVPFFLHVKKLEVRGISAFHGSQTFPYVTELTMYTNGYQSAQMDHLLRTLEQLPLLETVHIVFCTDLYTGVVPRMTLLSRVQTMSLSRSGKSSIAVRLPQILEHLQLPRLTSLCVQVFPRLVAPRPVFPVTRFGERLPNFTELPELQVNMGSGEVTFRNPSHATLVYRTGSLLNYESVEREIWRPLPLHSVRRLTVNMMLQPSSQELEWLVGLLRDLKYLEHLKLGGECGSVIRWLYREMTQETIPIPIQVLTVHCGEHERHQAVRLKRLADDVGLTTTVVCMPAPGAREERGVGVGAVHLGGFGP